jgi:hypothetical protein
MTWVWKGRLVFWMGSVDVKREKEESDGGRCTLYTCVWKQHNETHPKLQKGKRPGA